MTMPAPVFSPMPPWHMWGNTIELTALRPPGAGVIPPVASGQLFKVSYRRPETWSFFVGGRLLTGVVSDVDMTLVVAVDFMAGIGRTMFQSGDPLTGVLPLPVPWVEFRWFIPAGVLPGTGHTAKWTTQAPTPPLDDSTATSTQIMQWLPAQDIQSFAQARILLGGVTAINNSVTAQITSWVSPRVHVRPDWFEGDEEKMQFLGAETGGT